MSALPRPRAKSAIDRSRPWLGAVGGDTIGAPPPLGAYSTPCKRPARDATPLRQGPMSGFEAKRCSPHPRGNRLENVSRELATSPRQSYPALPYICICCGAVEQYIRSRTQHRGRIPSAQHARNGSPPCRGEQRERDKRERGLTVRARGGPADLARLRLVCCDGGRMYAGSTPHASVSTGNIRALPVQTRHQGMY